MSHVTHTVDGGVDIKAWTEGVAVGDGALRQLSNLARVPVVQGHVAVMPDVHVGMGATIGSVIPTSCAIIPAAVGVDIGCGMMAVRTDMHADRLPDSLARVRSAIEKAVPHGRSNGGKRRDRGAWGEVPERVDARWAELSSDFERICAAQPRLARTNHRVHLGTLGTGNHFIEVCLDEEDRVWFMLHSGSRGVGNAIGRTYIQLAQLDMKQHLANLPDHNLAYLREGSEAFDDYVEAVGWAQSFARINREIMMDAVVKAAGRALGYRFKALESAVNCHHNYVQKEEHFGQEVWLTRKGAVSARKGQLGIIPGSMGARSYIVRGKGDEDSYCSCSHGAGRAMSRGQARRSFTLQDHREATAHVECRKDKDVIDETPMAYKDIDKVMAAQRDLVEIVHTLRQVVCVKG
jgi:tRNA-splicing ligase RtcB